MTVDYTTLCSFRHWVLYLFAAVACNALANTIDPSVNVTHVPSISFTNVLSRVDAYNKARKNGPSLVIGLEHHRYVTNEWWYVWMINSSCIVKLLKCSADKLEDRSAGVSASVGATTCTHRLPAKSLKEAYGKMNELFERHGDVVGIEWNWERDLWHVRCIDAIYAEDPANTWSRKPSEPKPSSMKRRVPSEVKVEVDI